LLELLDVQINGADILVFSDFNYGCLPQSLVDKIILKAKLEGVIVAADSQSSSQVGNIARFKNANLITPTEREARISLRDQENGLVILSEKLRIESNAKNILLKLGEEGLMIHSDTYGAGDWLTDQIEALNRAPRDVAGAGDSLLISSALALAAGGNIWEAAYIGSLAAAVQVGRVGNIPIKQEEILDELNKM
jgi:bifunctional ADP-heptose synthase (sugar kinase/adenylyltransferase)